MRKKQYVEREVFGIILGPIMLFLVTFIFICAGLIQREFSRIYWTMALISSIAGIINFLITYKLTCGGR